MKLYLWEYSRRGKEYDIYNNLSEAIGTRGTEKLYEINLKENEQICKKSLFEYIYYVDDRGKVRNKADNEVNCHYTFIIKDGENIQDITIEKMNKKVDEFQKRLKKFTDIDKAKHSLELQIKGLQNELDRLNGK